MNKTAFHCTSLQFSWQYSLSGWSHLRERYYGLADMQRRSVTTAPVKELTKFRAVIKHTQTHIHTHTFSQSTLKILSENCSKQPNLNYYILAVHSFMIIHRRLKDSEVKLSGSDKNNAASESFSFLVQSFENNLEVSERPFACSHELEAHSWMYSLDHYLPRTSYMLVAMFNTRDTKKEGNILSSRGLQSMQFIGIP